MDGRGRQTVLFFFIFMLLCVGEHLAQPFIVEESSHHHSKDPTETMNVAPAVPRIVISLTTTPARIEGIEPTLRSLFKQDLRPDAIYLHTPKNQKRTSQDYVIPRTVKLLQKKYSHFKVVRGEKDYGPITKLLPTLALERNPSTLIITLDDDHIYHRQLVKLLIENFVKANMEGGASMEEVTEESLFEKPQQHHQGSKDKLILRSRSSILSSLNKPTKALGFRGWNHSYVGPSLQIKSDSRSQEEWDALLLKDDVSIYPTWDVLEGYAGVIYSRSFFDEKEFIRLEEEAPCFFTDDVFISAYLTLKGIGRVARLPSSPASSLLWKKNQDNEAQGALRLNDKRFEVQKECVEWWRTSHNILYPYTSNNN